MITIKTDSKNTKTTSPNYKLPQNTLALTNLLNRIFIKLWSWLNKFLFHNVAQCFKYILILDNMYLQKLAWECLTKIRHDHFASLLLRNSSIEAQYTDMVLNPKISQKTPDLIITHPNGSISVVEFAVTFDINTAKAGKKTI
jgi:hypothetical protein